MKRLNTCGKLKICWRLENGFVIIFIFDFDCEIRSRIGIRALMIGRAVISVAAFVRTSLDHPFLIVLIRGFRNLDAVAGIRT